MSDSIWRFRLDLIVVSAALFPIGANSKFTVLLSLRIFLVNCFTLSISIVCLAMSAYERLSYDLGDSSESLRSVTLSFLMMLSLILFGDNAGKKEWLCSASFK